MLTGTEKETVANPGAAEAASDVAPTLTPGFTMFAERLRDMDDVNALNAIRSRRRFSRKELQHLKSNLPDKPKTQAAIKAQLSKG